MSPTDGSAARFERSGSSFPRRSPEARTPPCKNQHFDAFGDSSEREGGSPTFWKCWMERAESSPMLCQQLLPRQTTARDATVLNQNDNLIEQAQAG